MNLKSLGSFEFRVGTLLIVLWLMQTLLKLEWAWLAKWQALGLYKFLTGLVFLAYILYQWKLTKVRAAKLPPSAQHTKTLRQTLMEHKVWGLLGPVIFIVHTQKWGHHYLLWLSIAFFLVFALGVFHEKLMRIKLPYVAQAVTIAHIGFSTLLMGLIGYHIYITATF